jgi:hypothetical protein
MTLTDLLQVVPTRLIQAVRDKLLRACCHKLVETFYVQTISDLLEQLVATLLAWSTLLQDDNNLFQTCHNNWEQALRAYFVDKLCEIFTCVVGNWL